MIDKINEQFGEWTVISPFRKDEVTNKYYCMCRCSCGQEKEVLWESLRDDRSKSCGCIKNFKKPPKDLRGQKFGTLIPVEPTDERENESVVWICQCDCGTLVKKTAKYLQRKTSNPNCGCRGNIKGRKFDRLTAVKLVGSDSNNNKLWECLCECGAQVNLPYTRLVGGLVHSCGCINSLGEYNISKILSGNNIPFKKEFTFNDLKGDERLLRYDFAIFYNDGNLRCLVEFDGEQHYDINNKFYRESVFRYDKLKNSYAKDHNIPLIRIPYSKKNDITLELILGEA